MSGVLEVRLNARIGVRPERAADVVGRLPVVMSLLAALATFGAAGASLLMPEVLRGPAAMNGSLL